MDDSDGRRELPVLFTVLASPAPSGPGPGDMSKSSNNVPAPPENQPSAALLFFTGVAGAVGREILRWRRLSGRRRTDLFRKPKYFAISAIQILLGGAIALIFGNVVSVAWSYVIGFVSGAGLEEIVRRAMMLKVWTPPVPHGPTEANVDDS